MDATNTPTFDGPFRSTKRSFMLCGIPGLLKRNETRSSTRRRIMWFIYTIGIANLAYHIIAEFMYAFQSLFADKFLIFAEATTCCLTGLYCIVKTLNLILHKDLVEDIMRDLENLWPKQFDERSLKLLNRKLFIIMIILKIYSWLMYSLVILFNSGPWVVMLFQYIQGKPITMLAPFYVYYPFNWTKNYSIYAAVYIVQSHAATLTTLGTVGADGFLSITLTYLSLYFDMLCYKLEECADHSVDLSPEEQTIVEAERIKDIIVTHNFLIKICKKVRRLFSFVLLVNVTCSSIVLCMLLVAITISKSINIFKYFVFIVYSLMQIFKFCWFCDKIKESSSNVSQFAYNSNWMNASLRLKKCIIIIMLRCKKYESLTAMGFMEISVKTFSIIVKMSWSYFTLLHTMYEKITSH